MDEPPLSQVSRVWEQPSSPSLVPWVKGVVVGEARGPGALRRTALVRERAMGRDYVRRVKDVPIWGRRGPGEGLELDECPDEHQGIWRPLAL